MNPLPNPCKWQNLGFFGQNIGYQIGISAKEINYTGCNLIAHPTIHD
jgi:hypothetical protein